MSTNCPTCGQAVPEKPAVISGRKVAICVGHSRWIDGRRDGGAVSVDGTNEWNFNSALAARISALLSAAGIKVIVINDYQGSGYTTAQKWLAGVVKQAGCDVAVELHFNSSDNASARGHEWLYWGSSEKGKRLAQIAERRFAVLAEAPPSRGAKPLDASSRGAEFVKLTHCPAIICEPFFGSNQGDWLFALKHQNEIASAIASSLVEFLD